jgi:acyl carrier protein
MPVADWTQTERTIARIWSEILQTEDFGRDDEFFDVGGTSLGLLSVVLRMSEDFGIPIDTGIVEDGATIMILAQRVDSQLNVSGNASP